MSTQFGEVADLYDEVRPQLPAELAELVLAYAGDISSAVEAGAGTGKATVLFAGRGFPITCVEPDPRMAAVLDDRVPEVAIEVAKFEDWQPPAGGVSLLYAALAWHWFTPVVRAQHAERALAPGGTLAVIAARSSYADPDVKAAMEPLFGPDKPRPPISGWGVDELRDHTNLTDIEVRVLDRIDPATPERFVALHETTSWYRMLPEAEQRAKLTAMREITTAYADRLDMTIHNTLILARHI
ncbi:MAG: class I SAM-dependent methyltransferase [Hamadaea sp.]|uniref:class I SAM-dependent methyltransferase n=1 Tax=Hamadaea sp. TaxID=2024425 RepID=UPI00180F5B23|nr:class I SAM-dependent methyltransferase [Hamadaea sp.]NUT22452.1 class I SAM-dependent methyltransferase [Hamadaea sp.]